MTGNIDDDPTIFTLADYQTRPRALSTDRFSINTATGGYLNIYIPNPDDITIEDIAAGLARQCRFGGQLPGDKFYSVAQHCVHVARALRDEGCSWSTQLQGLLHDGSEAFMGDMQAPLKRLIPAYKEYESGLQRIIYAKFGLSQQEADAVKVMDQRVFLVEKVLVLGNTEYWPNAPKLPPADIAFTVWDWRVSKDAFLHEFEFIVKGMN